MGGLAPQHGWQISVPQPAVQGARGRRAGGNAYGRVLVCILLAWVLGQEPSELTSPPQRAIHADFSFVFDAKKIRLTVLQTDSGTFCLSVLPSLKDILR